MLDKYAIVPSVGQAKVSGYTPPWEPGELSHQYGMNVFRFLEPLVRE